MYHLKIIAFFAFVTVFAKAKGCELNQMTLQKDGMECAAKQPLLMMQIAQHMEHPEEMEKLGFLCSYQKEIVDIMLCMMDKVEECAPEEVKPILMNMLPDKQRLLDGVKFTCENQNVLQDNCMQSQIQSFAQCYMAKVSQIRSGLNPASMLAHSKGLLCRVIRSEESCFKENKGTCSQNFIDVVIKALEKFFPMTECPDNKLPNKDFANSVLGNILIHGQPQGYSPLQYKPYIIKN